MCCNTRTLLWARTPLQYKSHELLGQKQNEKLRITTTNNSVQCNARMHLTAIFKKQFWKTFRKFVQVKT